MSKFEPKITPFNGVYCEEDVKGWCLRNVNENLRRFKAEFLRRYMEDDSAPSPIIMDDMLPDDPPKATGDDARDAARWRWLISQVSGIDQHLGGGFSFGFSGNGGNAKMQGLVAAIIDAAMAREREAAK